MRPPVHPWQYWREGFKATDLKFYCHHMVKAAAISERMPPAYRGAMLENLVTARQARLIFPNGGGLSCACSIAADPGVPVLHGDPREPDYEVMVLGQCDGALKDTLPHIFDEPIRNMTLAEIDELIPKLAAVSGLGEILGGESECITIPDTHYDRKRHGSFIYDDVRMLDETLWANRVLVGPATWAALRHRQTGKHSQDAAIAEVNHWCARNLSGAYAWTCAGPSWVFERQTDAMLFRVVWS